MPAGAQTAPTEAPAPMDPLRVSGRDALVLPLPAQPSAINVSVTDLRGNVSSWTLEPPTADAVPETPYEVNLEGPDDGIAPVNGTASATVTGAQGDLLPLPLILDRDPVAPTVATVQRDGDVTLLWNRVSGPGPVTYRVQRAAAGGAFKTIRGAGTELRYIDSGRAPGRYRYSVTAAVPAARAGLNFSQVSVVAVRVTAPEAIAPATPTEEAVAAPPATPRRTPTARPTPRRDVAATGDIRRPVAERRVRRGSPAAPTLQPLRWRPRTQQRIASGPSIAAPRPALDDAPVAAPPLARVIPVPPVALPPVGTLAVDAASAGSRGLPPISPATWLATAALAGMFIVSARRRDELSLVPDGPR